ncbi:MAG: sensor histidine kinase [Comamonadaceae bacterium]|nr:MAG: sensor histidine kinase [Comamonadaceae bacterium]
MLRHVMLPLVLIWLAGTAATLGVASHFTEQAFDRALLDDAYSIASHVRPNPDGEVALQLTAGELTAALFDQAEAVHFSVRRPDGTRLAGAHLPEIALQPREPWSYDEFMFGGQHVRAVALRHTIDGVDYPVLMAHTTRVRGALVQRLLVFGALPLLVLLVFLALWLWRGIERDLAPLGKLQAALTHRDAKDLSAVPLQPSTREIEQVGHAVNQLFERLGHSVRAQQEFAGNVAHELRTPLAGIRALADYGITHPEPEVWRAQLRQITVSAARAGRLVNQLLDLARADEGDTALRRERLLLGPLVRQAVMRHLDKADAHGVDLGARGLEDPGPGDVAAWADAALVDGILDNLIDNALRYGGRTLTVELSHDAASGTCTISVVDDGPGISESARRAMLQRWAQGQDGEKLGQGAGLGLSIVARYAELLGARLNLDNADAQGGLRASITFTAA